MWRNIARAWRWARGEPPVDDVQKLYGVAADRGLANGMVSVWHRQTDRSQSRRAERRVRGRR